METYLIKFGWNQVINRWDVVDVVVVSVVVVVVGVGVVIAIVVVLVLYPHKHYPIFTKNVFLIFFDW